MREQQDRISNLGCPNGKWTRLPLDHHRDLRVQKMKFNLCTRTEYKALKSFFYYKMASLAERSFISIHFSGYSYLDM